MSAPLTLEDFDEFVQDVHGHRPFAWQRRLMGQVLSTGSWPDLLDVPTGAGKTMALDIALFALAASGATSPRRVVFVVDRRVIVSQVTRRAQTLSERLRTPGGSGSVVGRVASALRHVYGAEPDSDEPAFLFAELRGGIALDEGWARRPDVPTVLVSTVDQVGSRLLFRGYGVSPRMRPIHAGLLGNDALFLLDEVHLSRPFTQTLHELRAHHRTDSDIPDRWQVVEMTATPGEDERAAFSLTEEDLASDDVLGSRLHARKDARLKAVGAKSQRPDEALVRGVPETARSLPGAVVGIVVNRVATAGAIAAALRAEAGDDEVVLVTGRMRALDRNDLWERIGPRVEAGRDRASASGRLFVVATQTIEAGADLDFDAMVTEIAPMDSLRQRFGRVDRLGQMAARGTPAQIVIVAGLKQTGDTFEDAVYSTALSATWRTLWEEHGEGVFDAGTQSTALLATPETRAPTQQAPLLLGAHLDALAQTLPTPAGDPDIALWLHGPQESSTDVNIVWRADLTDVMLVSDAEADARGLADRAMLCPPKSSESISVPIWAARSWLLRRHDQAGAVADVDQAAPLDDDPEGVGHPALRWTGADSSVISAAELRPGDTIVVPSSRGGIQDHNWDPTASIPVSDLGDRAQWEGGTSPVLRLAPDVVVPHLDGPINEGVTDFPRPDQVDELLEPDSDRVAGHLQVLSDARPAAWLGDLIRHLLADPRRSPTSVRWHAEDGDSEAWYVVRGRRPQAAARSWLAGLDRPSASIMEPDGTDTTQSFTGGQVALDEHGNGVGQFAERFAQAAGLAAGLVADLALAGRLHDLGKADPRFQAWLCDGDEIAASRAPGLLAKSGSSYRDLAARRIARDRSGYPDGMRHELLSAALVASTPEILDDAADPELVLHLVASHHGFCRGLAPAQHDPDPREVEVVWDGRRLRASTDHGLERLDGGVAERFWRLHRRYGAHVLAWLETILRLADHRQSELEQEEAR